MVNIQEHEALTTTQNVLIWLFAGMSYLFGIFSATSYLVGPSEINILVFPLTLLNVPVSIGTLLCGWYLTTHRLTQFGLFTLIGGAWGLFACWLFLSQM